LIGAAKNGGCGFCLPRTRLRKERLDRSRHECLASLHFEKTKEFKKSKIKIKDADLGALLVQKEQRNQLFSTKAHAELPPRMAAISAAGSAALSDVPHRADETTPCAKTTPYSRSAGVSSVMAI
jgi:hypothetical protein